LDFDKTEKGTRFRIERRKHRDVIVFPVGKHAKIMGYAPTEKEILETKDHELIDIYNRIDNQNNEWKIAREESIPFKNR